MARLRRWLRNCLHGLAAMLTLLNIKPNGRNINDGCGALHPACVAAEKQKSAERAWDLLSTETQTAAC